VRPERAGSVARLRAVKDDENGQPSQVA